MNNCNNNKTAPHPTYPRPERLDKNNHRNDSLFNQIYALSLMKSVLESKNIFKDENTITKLEEKEKNNMSNEIESMKILEACDYLLNHKDEYLVAKDNNNLELHFGDNGFYTKDLDTQPLFIKELVMDNHKLNTKWVKPQSLHMYNFLVLGYLQDKLIYNNVHIAKSKKDLCICLLDSLRYTLADEICAKPKYRNKPFFTSDIRFDVVSLYDYEGNQVLAE